MRVSVFLLLAIAVSGCMGPSAAPSDLQTGMATAASEVFHTRMMESNILAREVRYHVVLPPSYATAPERRYPVIYWLHGSGGYPPGAVPMLAGRFHAAMTSGRIPEAIVLFPDAFGHSLWMNNKDGSVRIEDFFIREFVPSIDASMRTKATRGGRVLEGGSMGGYGAARLALRHPHLFGAVSMLNPGPMQPVMNVEEAPIVGREGARRTMREVFGDDGAFFTAQSPWEMAADYAAQDEEVDMRLILGALDPTLPVNLRFADRLTSLGIAHDVLIVPDAGHEPRAMFSGLGDDYWDFFASVLASD